MNWGKSITLVLILFAGFIIYMVTQFFNKNVDLVAEDYYELELNYNDMYSAKQNGLDLNEHLRIQKQGDYIYLELPDFFRNKEFSADILFYKPDNAEGDYRLNTRNHNVLVEKSKLSDGNYVVKVMVDFDHTRYFFEEVLLVNSNKKNETN